MSLSQKSPKNGSQKKNSATKRGKQQENVSPPKDASKKLRFSQQDSQTPTVNKSAKKAKKRTPTKKKGGILSNVRVYLSLGPEDEKLRTTLAEKVQSLGGMVRTVCHC